MIFMKRIISIILCFVLMTLNMIVVVSAESATEQSSGTIATSILYRYRKKLYTSSTEKLQEPWKLYDTTIHYNHSAYSNKYLNGYETSGTGTSSGYTYSEALQWRRDNSSRYCFHSGPTQVYRFISKRGYTYIYVTNINSVDVTKYSYVGKSWRFEICNAKTEYLKYHYYKWSDWSEWSDTPVTATDDMEVEARWNGEVGDFDGNGDLSASDAVSLLNYVLFEDVNYPIKSICDFNNDSVVTEDDAIYLLYHALYGDEYPLS